MKADEARITSRETINTMAENHRKEVDRQYKWLMEYVVKAVNEGKRKLPLSMKHVHYSLMQKLLCDGYNIEDSETVGDIIISW